MANYPTILLYGSGFGQLDGSTEKWLGGVTVDRSVDGSVKARSFYAAKKRMWTIKHDMTPADILVLETFYDTNRVITFSFTFAGSGSTYSNCFFEQPPDIKFSSGRADVTVEIVQR